MIPTNLIAKLIKLGVENQFKLHFFDKLKGYLQVIYIKLNVYKLKKSPTLLNKAYSVPKAFGTENGKSNVLLIKRITQNSECHLTGLTIFPANKHPPEFLSMIKNKKG
jgi:hypothetical protein